MSLLTYAISSISSIIILPNLVNCLVVSFIWLNFSILLRVIFGLIGHCLLFSIVKITFYSIITLVFSLSMKINMIFVAICSIVTEGIAGLREIGWGTVLVMILVSIVR